jgi:hypothetical protein
VLFSRHEEGSNELKALCRDRPLTPFGLDLTLWSVAAQPITETLAVARALLLSGGHAIALP